MIASEGLVPSPYAYASLLNAYVNTGTMDGAEALMERMREVGCAPNVVAYTTMLKGYMLVADVDAKAGGAYDASRAATKRAALPGELWAWAAPHLSPRYEALRGR